MGHDCHNEVYLCSTEKSSKGTIFVRAKLSSPQYIVCHLHNTYKTSINFSLSVTAVLQPQVLVKAGIDLHCFVAAIA